MPHRYLLIACLLFCFTFAHAKEKVVLTPDLIELLGELDDDDRESLDVAMKDFENKSSPKSESVKPDAPMPQNRTEVGANK